jgi:predicted ATPase
MRECLALAVAIDHPLSIAMAYNFAATFYQARRETEVVAELEAVRAEYAKKHDFDVFLLLGEIYRGWLAVERGEAEEGLAQIEHGLMAYRAIGAELGRPTFLGILADVYYRLGRTEDAMATLDEAVALADKTGLHYWDADLRRLKGTFLLRSDPAAAESSFVEAIEIARGQGAKWHELRAATGLARLWQRQGDRKRAYSMLSEICGWFTEGFETPDVLDASVLLGDLGAASGEPGRARR